MKSAPPPSPLADLERLRNEFRDRVPVAQRMLEVYRSDPGRADAIQEVREVLHKIAGVAAPLGAPLVSAVARLGEELAVLAIGGKLPQGTGALMSLGDAIAELDKFMKGGGPVPGAPILKVEPERVAPPVPEVSRGPDEPHRVLIVDDDPLSARLIEICLGDAGFATHYCRDSREALTTLEVEMPDLIILDLMMPGQDGFETCRQIRSMAHPDRTPIIFLTRAGDVNDRVEALRTGGDDFITKPFEPAELVARVRAHVQRHVTLREQLIRDAMTGAFSLRYFKQRLNQEVRKLERIPGALSVAMLDVDTFKSINDEHGHPAGDMILKELATEARKVIRQSDVFARYGGDEFAILFPGAQAYQAASILERLVVAQRAAKHKTNAGAEVGSTISVGLAEWHQGMSASSVIEAADRALYEAKRRGRNRLVVAESPADQERAAAQAVDAAPGRLKILLVDDSRLTREVLKLYLMSLEVSIHDAENGADALDKIRRENPNLVLADLRMPKLDGIGLCKTMANDTALRHIPVIILTGHMDSKVVESCLAAGAREVLPKPVEPVDLLDVVNRHLERR